jgi:hypothetical protein
MINVIRVMGSMIGSVLNHAPIKEITRITVYFQESLDFRKFPTYIESVTIGTKCL